MRTFWSTDDVVQRLFHVRRSRFQKVIESALSIMDHDNWQMGKALNESFGELFSKSLWTDVEFKCNDSDLDLNVSIWAHKIILASRSPVFQAMFYGPCADIQSDVVELIDTDAHTFTLFLKYLYTDTADVTEQTAITVMQLAHKYQVSHLVSFCANHLISMLMPDNACAILEQAIFLNEKGLQQAALDFIDDNGEKILETDGFYYVQLSTLELILKGDTFLASEKCIFNAAIKWAQGKCCLEDMETTGSNLRLVLGEAFKWLRLPAMSLEDFSSLTYKQSYLSFDELEETVSFIAGNDTASPYNATRARRARIVNFKPCNMNTNFNGVIDFTHYMNVTSHIKFRCKDTIKITGFTLSSLIKSPTAPDYINPLTKYTVGVYFSTTDNGENLLYPKIFFANLKTHVEQIITLNESYIFAPNVDLYINFHIMSDPMCMVLVPIIRLSNDPLDEQFVNDTVNKGLNIVEFTYTDNLRFVVSIRYESKSNRN